MLAPFFSTKLLGVSFSHPTSNLPRQREQDGIHPVAMWICQSLAEIAGGAVERMVKTKGCET
jgi:hypothetical protein